MTRLTRAQGGVGMGDELSLDVLYDTWLYAVGKPTLLIESAARRFMLAHLSGTHHRSMFKSVKTVGW